MSEWAHELNPLNMNGSLNNQVAAGFSLMLGDHESAMDLCGVAQIEDCGGSESTINSYLGSLSLSYSAVSIAVGRKVGLSWSEIGVMGSYGATQSAMTGGTPLEWVNSASTSIIGGSVARALGNVRDVATEMLENTMASMGGNAMSQAQSGEEWSGLSFWGSTASGALEGSFMQGGDCIDNAVGVGATWISEMVVALEVQQRKDSSEESDE
jgi:hypothetical protein